MLIKQVLSPFGAALGVHVVIGAEISSTDPFVAVKVHSWPTMEDYTMHSGNGPTYVWYESVGVASLSGPNLISSIEASLAADSPTFSGASIVAAAPALDGAKAMRWANIKQCRNLFVQSPFTSIGSEFDANESKITGAVLDAVIAKQTNQPWSQAWVLANDSVVTLDADQMILVGQTFKARISAAWATGQYLRGLIDAASTIEDVEAVTWP